MRLSPIEPCVSLIASCVPLSLIASCVESSKTSTKKSSSTSGSVVVATNPDRKAGWSTVHYKCEKPLEVVFATSPSGDISMNDYSVFDRTNDVLWPSQVVNRYAPPTSNLSPRSGNQIGADNPTSESGDDYRGVILQPIAPNLPIKPVSRRLSKRIYTWVKRCCQTLWRNSKGTKAQARDVDRGEQDGYTGSKTAVGTIELCFLVDDREVKRYAKAIYDTGNPINLISPSFIQNTFGLEISSTKPEIILETPGGGVLYSTGTVQGRWCPASNRGPDGVFADDKFVHTVFEVCKEDQRFDVVIGYNTIQQEGLLTWRRDLGLMGFLPEPIVLTEEEIREREKVQAKKKAANDAKKKANEDKKVACTSP